MITKEQFEKAYIKFTPAKHELFYLKHLSAATLHIKPISAILISLILIIPFIFALLINFSEYSKIYMRIPSLVYAIILAIVGTYGLIIRIKRIKRIKNICKELNISKQQYEEIVERYYYENYYPDIKDYIYSILPENE